LPCYLNKNRFLISLKPAAESRKFQIKLL
jgi:hypothetical protein